MDTPMTSTPTSKLSLPSLAEQFDLLRDWVAHSYSSRARRIRPNPNLELRPPANDFVPTPDLEEDEVELLRLVLPTETGTMHSQDPLTRTLIFYLDVLDHYDAGLITLDLRLGASEVKLRDMALEPGLQRVAFRPFALWTPVLPRIGSTQAMVDGTKYSLAGFEALAFLAFCPEALQNIGRGGSRSMSLSGFEAPDLGLGGRLLSPSIYRRPDGRLITDPGPGNPQDTTWIIPTFRELGPVRPFAYVS